MDLKCTSFKDAFDGVLRSKKSDFLSWKFKIAVNEQKPIGAFLSLIAVSLLIHPCYGQSTKMSPQVAPVNPEFMRAQGTATTVQQFSASGHALGHRPSPLNIPGISPTRLGQTTGSLPATYDLRLTGRVTPVRDQGACGSCWAFGALASLESGLLPGETWDFSENNLKNTHGFDWSPCSGGNTDIAAAYLTRWSGPVNEADDPYQATDYNTSPSGLAVRKHLQDVIYLGRRMGSTENDLIKQAVMQYGAVDISMYWADQYYSAANKTYSCNYTGSSGTNHDVAIVGWDDNFDRNRFKYVPAGNGAFIVRNSWGSSWGESGYFYLSYYDTVAGRYGWNEVFDLAEPLTHWTRAYQYDPLGWDQSWGFSSDTAWFANVFTAAANESIGAVSFYVPTPNAPYTIRVYTSVSGDPNNGTLKNTTAGTLATAGYHTIPLASQVGVTAGATFSVIVQLQTPGYSYPVPVEAPFYGYSSNATASAGQSYMSGDGSTWYDMTYVQPNTNVCIKAFATTGAGRILGDFDGNGVPDLVWQNDSTHQVSVNYYGGTGGAAYQGWNWLSSSSVAGWHVVGIGDFDGNGVPDVVWQNDSTRQVTVHYYGGTGGATYQGWNWLNSKGNPGWSVAAVADMDGDGIPDLIWQNDSTRQVTVNYYGGSGGATYRGWNWLDSTGAPGWMVVGAGDFDSNGVPDLVLQNDTTRQVKAYYFGGSGGATYMGSAYLNASSMFSWHVAAVADFNSDGVPDVVWQNDSTRQVTVNYYGSAGGTTLQGWNWLNSAGVPGWSVAN